MVEIFEHSHKLAKDDELTGAGERARYTTDDARYSLAYDEENGVWAVKEE